MCHPRARGDPMPGGSMKRYSLCAAVVLLASASLSSYGELRRPGFLGIEVGNEDGKIAVRRTVETGSAAAAGVKAGDVVVGMDGKAVASPSEFVAAARSLHGGDVATIDVVREGSPVHIRV